MSDPEIAEWVKVAAEEAAKSKIGLAAYHLPDIGAGVQIPTSLSAVSDMMNSAATALRTINAPGVVRLVMHMTDVAEVDTTLPDFADWPFENIEPPSLYYLHPRHMWVPHDRESYQRGYEAEQLNGLPISAFYDCSRSLWARSHGWEFSRMVWFSPL